MTLAYAFEISVEDISNVLLQMGLDVSDEEISRSIFEEIDHEEVAKAALHGDDLDDQTTYAYQEIRKQLEAFGYVAKTPSP